MGSAAEDGKAIGMEAGRDYTPASSHVLLFLLHGMAISFQNLNGSHIESCSGPRPNWQRTLDGDAEGPTPECQSVLQCVAGIL